MGSMIPSRRRCQKGPLCFCCIDGQPSIYNLENTQTHYCFLRGPCSSSSSSSRTTRFLTVRCERKEAYLDGDCGDQNQNTTAYLLHRLLRLFLIAKHRRLLFAMITGCLPELSSSLFLRFSLCWGLRKFAFVPTRVLDLLPLRFLRPLFPFIFAIHLDFSCPFHCLFAGDAAFLCELLSFALQLFQADTLRKLLRTKNQTPQSSENSPQPPLGACVPPLASVDQRQFEPVAQPRTAAEPPNDHRLFVADCHRISFAGQRYYDRRGD